MLHSPVSGRGHEAVSPSKRGISRDGAHGPEIGGDFDLSVNVMEHMNLVSLNNSNGSDAVAATTNADGNIY